MKKISVNVSNRVETAELVKLANSIYGELPDYSDERFYQWQYQDNPDGRAVIGSARAGDELVGHYAVLPTSVLFHGKPCLAGLGVNAMTRADYQGQGIFAKLVSLVDQESRRRGFKFSFAIGGAESSPWFLKVLRYQMLADIPIWVRPVRLAGWPSTSGMGSLVRGCAKVFDIVTDPLFGVWKSRQNSYHLKIMQVSQIGREFDSLLAQERGKPISFSVRTREHMSWRFQKVPTRSYSILGAYDQDVLCAYIISRIRNVRQLPGVRVASVADLCAEPSDRGKSGASLLVAEMVSRFRRDGVAICLAELLSKTLSRNLRVNGFVKIPGRWPPWRHRPLIANFFEHSSDLDTLNSLHFMSGDYDMG